MEDIRSQLTQPEQAGIHSQALDYSQVNMEEEVTEDRKKKKKRNMRRKRKRRRRGRSTIM